MSNQIIKQPDGLYAVWSTVVDDFVLIDASPADIIDDWVNAERERIRENVFKVVTQLNIGGKPYHQFTMTWEDACRQRDRIHKKQQR